MHTPNEQDGRRQEDEAKKIRYRFAFDIGGTFTDLVLLGSDGSLKTAKVLSDQSNVVAPIANGVLQLCHDYDINLNAIDELVVGATTAVTNLVIERKGAKTALITTKGFRDVVAIGRELRYDIYNLHAPGPDPIIDRALRLEIDERTDAKGTIVRSPSSDAIKSTLADAKSLGAESIAVCLLHSFSNPQHELMVRELAKLECPGLPVSLSHEVLGELREYERSIATILNAYVMPKVGNYLNTIETGLRAIGLNTNLRVMQSNGGVISKSFGAKFPIRLLESGPAAGALGAAHAAKSLAMPDLIAFDMGGTTAKACLISKGDPGITTEFEAARTQRFKKGSGLPVRIPTVDLIEIGAGGGSIAQVDTTGLLKVGPQSAGSMPGPACYELGGRLPTVTDAALLLGYLDPAARLSNAVTLSYDSASKAMDEHVAAKLGVSIHEAAAGVHRIVCEQMAAAAKIHAVEKAKDIRKSTVLAFGGAGPLHARELARRTAVKHIVVPSSSGVFSAFGLLVAPMKLDMVRTRYLKLDDINFKELEQFLKAMEEQLSHELEAASTLPANAAESKAQAKLEHHGKNEEDASSQKRASYRFVRSADMRYVGQGFEVATALPADLSMADPNDIRASFETQYRRLFGSSIEGAALEILNWRVEAYASQGQAIHTLSSQIETRSQKSVKHRSAYFPCIRNWVNTPVLSEYELPYAHEKQGPALIEQAGSTVVIGPGDRYHKDQFGNIHIFIA